MNDDTDNTDFGFERVSRDEKAGRVRAVFGRIPLR